MAIVFFRTIIVFAAMLAAMRFMGKRQLGELELSELVVAVLISDLAAHPLQDIGIPLLNGLIPIVTLLCLELLISAGTMKSIRFRAMLCGKPSILIENGKINEKAMRQNRFTLDELTEELRGKDILDISKVKYAILETSGELNAILYPGEAPPSASQLGIDTAGGSELPVIIINDGRIIKSNLFYMGFDEAWLDKTLSRNGASKSSEVYLMTVDKDGKVFYAAKEKTK